MSILVTGGAGYIGSHLVSLLGAAGKDIIIFDNLNYIVKAAIDWEKKLK